MEIFELRYFLGVARDQNFHRASERLNVSPSSLNKAVARLEDELAVKLFTRLGRNIVLTEHGKLFQKRASQIVQLEEAARLELAGHDGTIQVVVAGPEILLAEMGVILSERLILKFPKCTFEFRAQNEETALAQVERGESHLALVTGDVPPTLGLTAKTFSEVRFETVVGKGHRLFPAARKGEKIGIKTLLTYPFVSPNHPVLGRVGAKQSLDGWRDDAFPRQIQYLTSSLEILGQFVSQGKALAYVPDYYARRLGLQPLTLSGCDYICQQKVKIVAKNPRDRSWLSSLF